MEDAGGYIVWFAGLLVSVIAGTVLALVWNRPAGWPARFLLLLLVGLGLFWTGTITWVLFYTG